MSVPRILPNQLNSTKIRTNTYQYKHEQHASIDGFSLCNIMPSHIDYSRDLNAVPPVHIQRFKWIF